MANGEIGSGIKPYFVRPLPLPRGGRRFVLVGVFGRAEMKLPILTPPTGVPVFRLGSFMALPRFGGQEPRRCVSL